MGKVFSYKPEQNLGASGEFVVEAGQVVEFPLIGPRTGTGIDAESVVLIEHIRTYLDEAVAFHKDERARKVLYGYRFELLIGPEREFSTLFLDAVETKIALSLPIVVGARMDVRVRLSPIDPEATFDPCRVTGKVIVQGHISRNIL